MSSRIGRSAGVLLSLILLASAATAASAQAEVEGEAPAPVPTGAAGLAEVALCEMPELGERAAPDTALIASIGDRPREPGSVSDLTAEDGDAPDCRLPTVEGDDVLGGGGPLPMFATNDLTGDAPGSPGIARVLHAVRATNGKEAGRILKDKKLRKAGKVARKQLTGQVELVCVELEEELEPGDSVVIATDVKGDPTKRAPSSVEGPDNPLSGVRDLYHVGRLPTDGSVFVGSTDLASGEFYTSKRPFLGWVDGRNVYFAIPGDGLGEDFRAVAFRSGQGHDVAGLGASRLIPTSGRAGWIADCISHVLIHEPLVLEDVRFPSQGEIQFCFSAQDEDLQLLEDWLDEVGDLDDVAHGVVDLTLHEDGGRVEESLPIDVFVSDDRVYFAFLVGYSAYGYHALEAIDDLRFDETGSDRLDALFERAAATIARGLTPVAFAADAGFLQGEAACVPTA